MFMLYKIDFFDYNVTRVGEVASVENYQHGVNLDELLDRIVGDANDSIPGLSAEEQVEKGHLYPKNVVDTVEFFTTNTLGEVTRFYKENEKRVVMIVGLDWDESDTYVVVKW